MSAIQTISRLQSSEFGGSHRHFKMSLGQSIVLSELASSDSLWEDFRVENLARTAGLGMFAIYILVFIDPITGERVRFKHCQGYIGSTNDLARRFAEHQEGQGSALTRAAIESGLELKIGAVFFSENRLYTEFALKERKRCNDFLFETNRPRKRGASLKAIHRSIKRNKERAHIVIPRKIRAREEREHRWRMENDPNYRLDMIEGRTGF